jgi:hypothetical protein
MINCDRPRRDGTDRILAIAFPKTFTKPVGERVIEDNENLQRNTAPNQHFQS